MYLPRYRPSIHEHIGNVVMLTALLIIALAICFFMLGQDLGPWPESEWLINYSGGFVRRGLAGQIFSLTSQPLYYSTLAQKISVVMFLFVIIYSWWRIDNFQTRLAFWLAVIVYPGALLDQAETLIFSYSMEFLGRKEIVFYLAAGSIVFTANRYGFFTTRTAIWTGAVSALMILTHELYLLFFALPILSIYTIDAAFHRTRPALVNLVISSTPIVIASLLVVVYHGDVDITAEILSSYLGTDAEGRDVAINALAWTVQEGLALSRQVVDDGSVSYWVLYALLCLIGSSISTSLIARTRLQSYLLIGLQVQLLAAVSLTSLIAWDIGRWLSIYSFSFAFMSILVVISTKERSHSKNHLGALAREPIAAANLHQLALIAVTCIVLISVSVTTTLKSYGPQEPVWRFDSPWSNQQWLRNRFIDAWNERQRRALSR
ncbi:hypothetical protein OAS86_05860 [Gammaproteobacteria bacterium]|nr:hypothetical protein [Gammaproteobacteria bacterium]